MGLFRAQAIAAKSAERATQALVLPRLSHLLLTSFVCGWSFLSLAWLSSAAYAPKTALVGWLRPVGGVTRIYARDEGIVSRVLISEGEYVVKGQPLLILNADQLLASGDLLEDLLAQQIVLQRNVLQERLQRLSGQIEQRLIRLETSKDQMLSQRAVVEDQVAVMTERLRLSKVKLQRASELVGAGYMPDAQYELLQSHHLGLESDSALLRRDALQVEQQLSMLEAKRVEFNADYRDRVDEVRLRSSELANRHLKLDGLRVKVIAAPVTGRVYNLQARKGEAVPRLGEPLLSLLGDDSDLTAELLLPASANTRVEIGASLRLRYDAFPYQKFGTQEARILSVSSTVLLPGELVHAALPVTQPVYRVIAGIVADRPLWRSLLKPGMTLRADLRGAERSLLQWFFAPLLGLQARL